LWKKFRPPSNAKFRGSSRQFFRLQNTFFLNALNPRAELPQLRVNLFVAAIQMIIAVDLSRNLSPPFQLNHARYTASASP
jgi:hypothetical protein